MSKATQLSLLRPCQRCGEIKWDSEFYAGSGRTCKACVDADNKRHREKRQAAARAKREEERAEWLVSPHPCRQCGVVKPPEGFYPHDPRQCKECRKANASEWHGANLDRAHKQRQEKYYSRPPEWHDEERVRLRDWKRAHPEVIRAYSERTAEETRRRARQWAQDNPEQARKNALASLRRRRARLRKVQVMSFTHAELEGKVAYWGDRCWVCHGSWDHIDHVKPVAKGGSHILCNLRPICASCNNKKTAKWPVSTSAHLGSIQALFASFDRKGRPPLARPA